MYLEADPSKSGHNLIRIENPDIYRYRILSLQNKIVLYQIGINYFRLLL